MNKSKEFEYESDMKNYYKSDEVAQKYFEAYNSKLNFRGRFIAFFERRSVHQFLVQIPNSTLLDIPTGTGKLAPVFKKIDANVMACDISKQMLDIAKMEFDKCGLNQADFKVCDAEKINETLNQKFDVAVCLRLLHRVPDQVKENILKELSEVANHCIVSVGIETGFHKIRRIIREKLLGGDVRDHCFSNQNEILNLLLQHFEIINSKSIFPLVSQEKIYLLKPLKD